MEQDRPDIVVVPPLAFLAAVAASLLLGRWAPLGLLPPYPWGPGLVLGLPLLAVAVMVNVAGAATE